MAQPHATDGLPPEFWVGLRQRRTALVTVWLLLGAGTGLLTWGSLYPEWSDGCVIGTVLLTAVFLYFSPLAVIDLRTDYPRLARIVPYFEADVTGADTFFEGYALARNCIFLDEIAARLAVTPLSDFGFEDEWRSRRARWYDPEEGLRTVNALIGWVREEPGVVNDPEGVMSDLERIQSRLTEAQSQERRFCLHLRADSAYSPMEFDQRRGKY